MSAAIKHATGAAGCSALALVFALGFSGGCSPAARDPRPSIVLVVTDTLRADAVSAYGAVEGTTPAFDALAAQGLLYSHAYAPSPWTLPSHASLFTGLGAEQHGVGIAGQMGLRDELTTLAERLRDAGYETVGVSENPLVSGLFGFAQGFERFAAISVEDTIREDRRPGSHLFDVVHEVKSFAEQRDPNRPFFLFVNLFDPHSPYQRRKTNRFLGSDASLDESWSAEALKESPNRICNRIPSPEELVQLHGLYLGDVAAADAKLGKIAAIARDAVAGQPLIVVATADHGEHFGEHRLLDHEFSVRAPVLDIPLAVQGLPDTPIGRIDEPVTLMDVSASILRWAGVAIAPEISGRPLPTRAPGADRPAVDLLALYSDAKLHVPEDWHRDIKPADEARDAKRSGCGPDDRVFGDMLALTRWPFKLIWFENYPAELYDLSWDPQERSDLVDLRPEISAPMIAEARRVVDEAGLAGSAGEAEAPSAERIETLRSLGYLE